MSSTCPPNAFIATIGILALTEEILVNSTVDPTTFFKTLWDASFLNPLCPEFDYKMALQFWNDNTRKQQTIYEHFVREFGSPALEEARLVNSNVSTIPFITRLWELSFLNPQSPNYDSNRALIFTKIRSI
jgi:hypothetical protein